MDFDEILVSVAQSFVEQDLKDAVISISQENTKHSVITFGVEDNSVVLNNKEMINQIDIEVDINLEDNTVLVEEISKNGCVSFDANGCKTQNLWEDRKSDYYMVVDSEQGKYLQCESYVSKNCVTTTYSNSGSKEHSYYEEKKLGKTIVNVRDEYSIVDGYPVSKVLKSFTKLYYNTKKSGE